LRSRDLSLVFVQARASNFVKRLADMVSWHSVHDKYDQKMEIIKKAID